MRDSWAVPVPPGATAAYSQTLPLNEDIFLMSKIAKIAGLSALALSAVSFSARAFWGGGPWGGSPGGRGPG